MRWSRREETPPKELTSAGSVWTKGYALEIDVVEEGEKIFAFNVTCCRYAEMYRELGIPQLGPILSCLRDFALIEGCNSRIRLSRTQTLMGGCAVL